MGGGEILLLSLIVQRKKLRHRPSISLGQEGILAAGILPFADGDGVIKGPPHFPVGQLLRPGGAQPEGGYGAAERKGTV